jgi:hypothetical protein
MNQNYGLWLAGCALLLGIAWPLTSKAAEPAQTGTVLLYLVGGMAPPNKTERETTDMELELVLRDGKLQPKGWGFAYMFNRMDHDVEISGEGEQLTAKVILNKDKWFPKANGTAQYQITLKREGDSYSGTYTGSYAYPGADGQITHQVKGAVHGKIYPLWTEPPAGFKKLEPNEHPRLIFRKHDLPTLKKRLETPDGKAIFARMMELLPAQVSRHPKTKPYSPAGYGLAYQLTGDKAHAQKAQELLADMLNLSGSQEIHYGPMAQSMAVTLDLCYDAWDEGFRQQVIDNLWRRVNNLATGTGVGSYSTNPWHNKQGVWAPSAGVAAICLHGEKTKDGQVIDAQRIIHRTARATRFYFQFNGTSNTGWCLEGSFYKRMTWNSGPGHMIQAYRTAFGGDPMAGWWGHWSILGEWMQQPPADTVVRSEGVGDDQSSGLFVLGLTTVPDSMKAGARWLFDRAFGLEGDKTFGLLWAYHAGYLLMNYPFDVAPEPPAKSLPWAAPDPVGGHWIFRKPWQNAQDTLAVLHVRSDVHPGSHWDRAGRTWDMQLFALGKQWIGPPALPEVKGAGAAMPTVDNADAFHPLLGPMTTFWNTTPDGKAVISLDMDPIYMQPWQRGQAEPAGGTVVRFARIGDVIDHGIRAKRYVALDLSGASGAPVLFAMIDQTQGAKGLTWNLKLAKDAGQAKVEGNTVTVGDPAAANMKCTFIAPKAPVISGDIQATGGTEYFAIITLQNGAAPAIKVEGEGLAAKVTVGGQSLRLDKDRIVLEK